MTKQECASYLASLASILKDQDAAGGHLRSHEIGAEYERTFTEFKRLINQEQSDETRNREQHRRR